MGVEVILEGDPVENCSLRFHRTTPVAALAHYLCVMWIEKSGLFPFANATAERRNAHPGQENATAD
jgi:hypothetical protein